MRHAAEWADVWYPVNRIDDPTMENTYPKFWSIVDEVGRDPSTIGIACAAVPGDPHILDKLSEQGVERVTLWLDPEEPDAQLRDLDTLAKLLPVFA